MVPKGGIETPTVIFSLPFDYSEAFRRMLFKGCEQGFRFPERPIASEPCRQILDALTQEFHEPTNDRFRPLQTLAYALGRPMLFPI